MKLKHLLIFALGAMTFLSCGDDESPIPSDRTVLNYDGPNFAAPSLGAGLHEFAARFTNVLLRNVEGRSIEQVSFYLYNVPSQVYINISNDLTPTQPGNILNTQLVTNLQANSWNTVTLNEPFLLDGTPVWIGLEVTLNSRMQTIGCDEGPANPNGDWLYMESDLAWDTFRNWNQESVNWNIRAVISD